MWPCGIVIEPLAGLFDCGANRVHGTALLKYRGSPAPHTPSPFDGPTNYADYINIKGIKGKAHQIIQASNNLIFLDIFKIYIHATQGEPNHIIQALKI